MEFNEALTIVKEVLASIGSEISLEGYDGVLVKRLEASNTLDDGRTTNQTHIAITGKQMDIFPYVRADGYFEVPYDQKDQSLKKYFIAQIPVYLHKENVEYLDPSVELFSETDHLVHVSIVRSRRNGAEDQIQMSMTNIDSPEYVSYRKLVHAKGYMILLKQERQLIYDLYCVKESDVSAQLASINNGFFNLETNTAVKIDELNKDQNNEKSDRIELSPNKSKECARAIIDCIYGIDGFVRLSGVLDDNDKYKYVKINTSELHGSYLQYAFVKPTSDVYNNAANGKRSRSFDDKTYLIPIGEKPFECKLSTEWVSTALVESGTEQSTNYLQALIEVANKYYADFLRIIEQDGKWYLEKIPQEFDLSKLPDVFDSAFARRYITSLLAKPFVILTGNSGTGKTRIARQFAQYLAAGEDNWLIVPVGADWTDNTRVLGYHNSLADKGAGKYEKTKIVELIERANAHPEIPYFLILDEMNLSHVERYFSDFLSHMEIPDDPFELDGYEDNNGRLPYPANLFVTGTVNIDETTYMFSPKVLDRANVVEFKPEKDAVLASFDENTAQAPVARAPYGMAEAFYRLAKDIRDGKCGIDETQMSEIKTVFAQIYDITESRGYEFAYRTVKEIKQYISAAYELADGLDDAALYQAIDEQLLQKILPKIHGNRKELSDMLEKLSEVCKTEGKELQLSETKIEQMKDKLSSVQYASFI